MIVENNNKQLSKHMLIIFALGGILGVVSFLYLYKDMYLSSDGTNGGAIFIILILVGIGYMMGILIFSLGYILSGIKDYFGRCGK